MSIEAGDWGFLDSCISGSRIIVFQLTIFGYEMMISLSLTMMLAALLGSMKHSRKYVKTITYEASSRVRYIFSVRKSTTFFIFYLRSSGLMMACFVLCCVDRWIKNWSVFGKNDKHSRFLFFSYSTTYFTYGWTIYSCSTSPRGCYPIDLRLDNNFFESLSARPLCVLFTVAAYKSWVDCLGWGTMPFRVSAAVLLKCESQYLIW